MNNEFNLSDEEIEALRISGIYVQINELKNELKESDYKITKCQEYSLVGLGLPYNIEEIHAERQVIRDKINELESEVQ